MSVEKTKDELIEELKFALWTLEGVKKENEEYYLSEIDSLKKQVELLTLREENRQLKMQLSKEQSNA